MSPVGAPVPAMPADVSLGELWRGQIELQRALREIAESVDALPLRLAADLDARSAERVDGFRREHAAQHEADDLRHQQLATSVATLWRIVWSVIGAVFVSIGGAILSLVIVVQGK